MKKSVLFSIDKKLIPILDRVAKKNKMTKSQIVEDYLKLFLPILDKEDPRDIVKESFDMLGNEVSGLFEDLEK